MMTNKTTLKVSLIFPREYRAIKVGGADYPLGILYIATYARNHNIDCQVHDLTFSSWQNLEEELKNRNPQVIGFSIFTPIATSGLKAIKMAKKILPNSIVIVGGPHAVVDETLINNTDIDIVVIGEGEKVFVDLIKTIENKGDLSQIPNIIYKQNGKPSTTQRLPTIENLDELPFPDRNLINIEKYLMRNRTLSLITARGCPFRCWYCQPTQRKIFGSTIKRRTPENVINEIKELVSEYGSKFQFAFYFVDDTFTYDKKWLETFCRSMKILKIQWRCITRVDMVDEDTVKLLKEAGCVGVNFGVESGSQRILTDVLKKDITVSQIKSTFKLTHKYGLLNLAFIMIGSPGENKEDLEKTVNLIKEIHPDGIQVSITTPLLGSNLYNACIENKTINIKSFDDYDYCKNNYPILLENLTENDLKFYKSKIIKTWKSNLIKNLPKYIRIIVNPRNRDISFGLFTRFIGHLKAAK